MLDTSHSPRSTTPVDPGNPASVAGPWLDRLVSAQAGDGSWPYQTGQPGGLEPTAFALLALRAWGSGPDPAARKGLAAMEGWQARDGSFSIQRGVPPAAYATALGMVATLALDRESPRSELARRWLIRSRSMTMVQKGRAVGHDVSLTGWSWVEGTHGWVEPTAWAVLALRHSDDQDHPRVREGLALLYDRAVEGGGWNYGNVEVLGRRLAAQPEATGVVLTATSGLAHPSITRALNYVEADRPADRGAWTKAWVRLGLMAHGRPAPAIPPPDRAKLGVNDILHLALLLLATAPEAGHPLLIAKEQKP